MTAVAALGVVGIGVALIFIMFSAPDVAITQLLVETLTVVLVAVAMLKLPHLNLRAGRTPPRSRGPVTRRGALVTIVLVGVLSRAISIGASPIISRSPAGPRPSGATSST
jgi:multicomponent Na+:H+ antiporter subunit A